MPDYEHSADVPAPPDALFAYLSDVRNLPAYVPRMTAAEPAGGERVHTRARMEAPGEGARTVEGEAWFRVDEDARAIEWGSEGENDYRGRLTVAPADGGSRVAVRLHTRTDHPDVQRGMEGTVDAIRGAAEAGL